MSSWAAFVRTLGPYQLLRKVGSGGMAEVWSARKVSQVAGEKFVAIKILARHVADNPRYREMFVSEARLSLLLNHANIISVFDVVEAEGECYMVMELVEGMTLSQLVRGLAKRGEKVPLEVAVYVIAELLRALAYAHGLQTEQGATIVHRDVSPQNVMVSTAGEVKLMDFGIARFSTEETSGNLVKGKLQYMPPEQLSRRTREPTIDLFAVGGVFQELVEGRRFRGGVDQEILLGMVFKGEVPELGVELPEPLARVRAQLLEADPDKRLKSAKEALAQIYDWRGYRNASLQLEELVQQFVEPSSATAIPIVEPSAATTIPVVVPSADGPSSDHDEAATVARDPFPGESGRLGQRSAPPWAQAPDQHAAEREIESEVDIVGHPGGTGGGPQPDPEAELATSVDPPAVAFEPGYDSEPSPAQPRRRGAILVAAFVGMFAIFSLIGWQAGWFGGSNDEPEVAVATEPKAELQPKPDTEAVAPAVEPDPEAEPNATGLSVEQALAVDEPERAPGPVREDGDEAVEEDSESSTSKKQKAKVSVEFTASDFYFVYVKVAGRTLTLEPKKTVKLPVGTHTVQFRQKPDQSWKKAGSIRLSRGASYKVVMKKPGSLKLSKK